MQSLPELAQRSVHSGDIIRAFLRALLAYCLLRDESLLYRIECKPSLPHFQGSTDVEPVSNDVIQRTLYFAFRNHIYAFTFFLSLANPWCLMVSCGASISIFVQFGMRLVLSRRVGLKICQTFVSML